MNFIGVDIEDITKFKNLFLGINFKKYTGVLNTIFTEKEIQLCLNKKRPYQHFAVRFSGKEAFLKALGTGLKDDILFSEIEFLTDQHGKPTVSYQGAVKREVIHRKIKHISVSFSHSRSTVTATVLMEKQEDRDAKLH